MLRLATIFIGLLSVSAAAGSAGFSQTSGQNSQKGTADSTWKAAQSLVGEWVGEGGGEPGQSTRGGFSFESDLQGAVLVRKSFAEYPASQNHPASRHDDLTVVYRNAGATPRATYFDNEGHVIDYALSASPDGSRIEFLSAPRTGEPRFRLTYVVTSPEALKLLFEIAPPGHPESFSPYLESTARRIAKK